MAELTISMNDLAEGKPQKFSIGTTDICVARVGDEVFAINDICTHSEVSLSEGEIGRAHV